MTDTVKTTGATRRLALGGLAAAAATVAMPKVLRAQKARWIGASATAQQDVIGVSLDFYAKSRRTWESRV